MSLSPVENFLNQEQRGGWLGMPRKYTLLDFSGAALGAYMAYMGIRDLQRRKTAPWQAVVALGLGGIMIWIHTQRFFYAPQDQRGFIKLAQETGITQADIDRLRPLLPPAPPLALPSPEAIR